MRAGFVPLLWLVALGCDQTDHVARTFVFEAPVPRVVLRGDSLAGICAEYGATEADVRAWNGLERREPKVGEVVHVWRPPRPDVSIASVIGSSPSTASARPPKAGARTTRAASHRAPAREASMGLGLVDLRDWMMTPSTIAPPVAVDPVALSVDALRIHDAGLLGSARLETGEISDLDVDLTARRSRVTGTSLAARGAGLSDRGAAESLAVVAPLRALGAPTAGGNYVPTTPVRPVGLPTPAAKRCLTTSTAQALGDDDIAGSRGLTSAQVRSSLAPFARHTSACIPAGASGSWSPTFGVTIGCDGRVSASWTVEGGGLPANVTSCIESTLRKAGFPAHDMPAGVDVTWPITFRK